MFKKTIALLCSFALIFSQLSFFNVIAAADRTAPYYKASTPKKNQTGVARNVKISIKFNEKIYKGRYFAKIKLVKSSNKKAQYIKRSVYRNYLRISHSLLAYSSYYVITIPARAVKDKAGNQLKKTITIKFKIRKKPIIIPTPTQTPVVTATPTATATVTNTPTNTVSPTATPSPRYYGEATPTGSPVVNEEDGIGVKIWNDGSTYIGMWEEGLSEGQGYYVDKSLNGSEEQVNYSHIGEFVDDDYGGFGKHTWVMTDDVIEYSGYWADGVISGKGTCVWDKNTTPNSYTGNWLNGERNGIGIYMYSDGDLFSGTWNANYRDRGLYDYSGEGIYLGAFNTEGIKEDAQGAYFNINGNILMGNFTDGELTGEGFTYTEGGNPQFQNGTYNQGVLVTSGSAIFKTLTGVNGTYTGYVTEEDVPNGLGKMEYTSGQTYIGRWVEGQFQGYGKFIYSDGDVYIGEFNNNLMDGQGKLTTPSGYTYTGQWVEGSNIGWSKVEFTGGEDTYIGEYNATGLNGFGIYFYESYGTYIGNFVEMQRHGKGCFEYTSGDCYVGDWNMDYLDGTGTMVYQNGNIDFSENWLNNQIEGKGINYFMSDILNIYVGNIQNEHMNGYGTLYKTDGTVQSGTWQNDSFIGPV